MDIEKECIRSHQIMMAPFSMKQNFSSLKKLNIKVK